MGPYKSFTSDLKDYFARLVSLDAIKQIDILVNLNQVHHVSKIVFRRVHNDSSSLQYMKKKIILSLQLPC